MVLAVFGGNEELYGLANEFSRAIAEQFLSLTIGALNATLVVGHDVSIRRRFQNVANHGGG